jgi:hypothetical protein
MAKGKIDREPEFAAFVGIDWADRKPVWCLQAVGSAKRETGELEHKVEAVEAWVAELCRRFGHRPIAVAVEQVKGALVFLLNKYECLHIFPVPSTMTASMRKALYPSGAKDDPRDADLLLDILGQHRDKLHHLSPDDEATRRVQNLVEERRKLTLSSRIEGTSHPGDQRSDSGEGGWGGHRSQECGGESDRATHPQFAAGHCGARPED